MSEYLQKWFEDVLNRLSEKVKRGEELSDKELDIVAMYVTNQHILMQIMEYIDKKNSDLELKLREEIRKTREDLDRKIEDVRGELTKKIEDVRGELTRKTEDLRGELTKKMEEMRGELTKKIEDVREELTKKIEEVRGELTKRIEDVRGELTKKIEDVRGELTKKIEDVSSELRKSDVEIKEELTKRIERVESNLDALRSDLGLVAEEAFVDRFVNRLERSGEKVINVYRHYESPAGEIDAIVETQEKVYVVEVKLKVEIKDVDDVMAKAKTIREEYGNKDVVPVITGSRISKAVRGYAKGMNVVVV